MTTTHPPRNAGCHSYILLAIVFELALAVVGLIAAWLGGVSLLPLVWPVPRVTESLGWGVVAMLLLMPMLVALSLCRWHPIARLRRLVGRFVRQLFGRAPWWQLAAVSIAAGVGEEVLFRGALQPLLTSMSTPVVGLLIASLLFGAVHAGSWSYFWLAALVGGYLGLLTMWRGEILSAIVAHALYDWIALTAIARGWFASHRPLFTVRC